MGDGYYDLEWDRRNYPTDALGHSWSEGPPPVPPMKKCKPKPKKLVVYVLFDNHADSWSGIRTFMGVFATPEAAEQSVRNSQIVWKRNPTLPLEPYFSVEETKVHD